MGKKHTPTPVYSVSLLYGAVRTIIRFFIGRQGIKFTGQEKEGVPNVFNGASGRDEGGPDLVGAPEPSAESILVIHMWAGFRNGFSANYRLKN